MRSRVCHHTQRNGSSLQAVLFLVLRNDSRPSAGLLKDCNNCNLKPNLRFIKVAMYF